MKYLTRGDGDNFMDESDKLRIGVINTVRIKQEIATETADNPIYGMRFSDNANNKYDIFLK